MPSGGKPRRTGVLACRVTPVARCLSLLHTRGHPAYPAFLVAFGPIGTSKTPGTVYFTKKDGFRNGPTEAIPVCITCSSSGLFNCGRLLRPADSGCLGSHD